MWYVYDMWGNGRVTELEWEDEYAVHEWLATNGLDAIREGRVIRHKDDPSYTIYPYDMSKNMKEAVNKNDAVIVKALHDLLDLTLEIGKYEDHRDHGLLFHHAGLFEDVVERAHDLMGALKRLRNVAENL